MSIPQTADPQRMATVSASRALVLGFAVFGLALAALILLCYTFPDGYDSFFFPQNRLGLRQFQAHLGLTRLPQWDFRLYSRVFRLLLLLLWAGYALLIGVCLRGTRFTFRAGLAVVAITAMATAVLAPPLFSSDVYANASHGRIFVLYGHNPYLWRPSGLLAVHDPSAPYLVWDWPTIYGPIWTWLEIAIAAVLRPFGLWAQVAAHKLLLGGALVAVALAGRRLAARFSPGRENVTLLAIGLNPLLILEGPGTGHNDLCFLAFLLFGAVFYFEKKYVAAALCLGLSVGIKPITLALLPWVLLDYSRGRTARQTLSAALVGSALVLLPLLLAFLPLWGGMETLAAMRQRAAFGQPHPGAVRALLLALYLGLSVWLWRWRADGGWLTAWALFSVALMFLLLVPPFPWYIAWFWPLFLLRWDRPHMGLSIACLALSLSWTMRYGLLTHYAAPPAQLWINMDGTKSAHRG